MDRILDPENLALDIEKIEDDWQEAWGSKEAEYIRLFNQLMAIGNQESYQGLLDIFQNENFKKQYENREFFAVMKVVLLVFYDEYMAGIENHTLNRYPSVEAIMDFFRQLRFLTFRINFHVDQEAAVEELVNRLDSGNLSIYWLKAMIEKIGPEPEELTVNLIQAFTDLYKPDYLDVIGRMLKGEEF